MQLTQGETETWEEFRQRRRVTNKSMRRIESFKRGNTATRLVAGGLRPLVNDVYSSRPTQITTEERARRRAANRVARMSRKVNAQ